MFLVFIIKTLDPDPVLDPDRYSAKTLDPVTDSMNLDPEHWNNYVKNQSDCRK
jgi:hypothetical protein